MRFSPIKKTIATTAIIVLSLLANAGLPGQSLQERGVPGLSVSSALKTNSTTVDLLLNNKYHLLLDFYSEAIFRVFFDSSNNKPHDPVARPPAQILVDNPRRNVSVLNVLVNAKNVTIFTKKVIVIIDKENCAIKAINLTTHKTAFEITGLSLFETGKVSLQLKENAEEYFFGGGVQNGRFSHKGKVIAIENQNSWTDGGVASPAPFYWSTKGYAVLWHSFKPGKYDFGSTEKGKVKLFHNEAYLDLFFMVDDGAAALLNDFYQLTGNPVLIPKFGFYEGHLNAYNRDYWKKDTTGRGMLFEDGLRYNESQKDNGGVKESLNGEKNNFQFSARAVIDRYKKHDMPLGWILPNDGYGAGYGQTGTLDSNILNLKSFGDYARKNGVQIGLWTQSDLHPKAGTSALLQRDIVKEVRDAGVRVLKTDVAWVGAGYSFGLNGVADVGKIIPAYGRNARPLIISLDGWAGTQRYATIWSGDQTGGAWEYIRFHIPTYIGSGLSGQPNISSDMDGIFGGKNIPVNVRDFQWKTFTPMQLNMDGWGSNEKYPHALGEPATSINRMYLKWKSALLPYTYSVAKQALDGLPIMRAMFLENANAFTLSTATQYQYLYGPYFLVAPVYQNTNMDTLGNDIRNNIYLPAGTWFDYFTGDPYEGGRVINYFNAPLWKLPVFVKNGAIIPLANPNNNVGEINKTLRIYELYPSGKTSFTEYDDDGLTEAYKLGKGVTTLIESEVKANVAVITVHPSKGNFDGFEKNKATEFRINVSSKPKKVTAVVGNKSITLKPVFTAKDFGANANVYFYTRPDLNQFATAASAFEMIRITKNPQLQVKLAAADITVNPIKLRVEGFVFSSANQLKRKRGALPLVRSIITERNSGPFTLKPGWSPISNADYYEILFNDMLYSTIKDTAFLFDGLQPETNYTFKIRGVNKSGYSAWTELRARTKNNPLQFAIKGIRARSGARSQAGSSLNNLFDFDESNMWHTHWDSVAVPFNIVMDLNSLNPIEKLQYLPRDNGRNGLLLKGKVFYSNNKTDWSEAGTIDWKPTNEMKEFVFVNQPTVRYIKIDVSEAVGKFGSGRELYVFKVPGSESQLPGDINNDKLIDRNDLTSYMNYTGLRKGDGDFEGYIIKGDINKNDLIDAYDISVAATLLDGGAFEESNEKLSGQIELSPTKQDYNAGEIIEIKVKGVDLKLVNAFSFALPYNADEYEFMGVQSLNVKQMENFTYDRLHSNRQKALYPTFVNTGDKETLNGSADLFIIRFRAKKNLRFDLKLIDGIVVDKRLNTLTPASKVFE
jgi:alpha-glucosidase (family GH31 glycosyl hydrolase)